MLETSRIRHQNGSKQKIKELQLRRLQRKRERMDLKVLFKGRRRISIASVERIQTSSVRSISLPLTANKLISKTSRRSTTVMADADAAASTNESRCL